MVPKFSVVVNVRNESVRLPRMLSCLKEFISCGGDIVVADCGSTDSTEEIAREAGCKFHDLGSQFMREFSKDDAKAFNEKFGSTVDGGVRYFDFASARNAAAVFAANDYILNLDAGDAPTVLDISAINELLQEGFVAAYKHYLGPNPSDVQTAVRFFDRRCWKYTGASHEYVVEKKPMTAVRVSFPDTILKVEYLRISHSSRSRNYLYGMCHDIMSCPTPRWGHYLGREFYYMKEWEAAIKVFEFGLTLPNAWYTEQAQSLCHMGECYIKLKNLDKARQCFYQSIDMDASRREPWIQLAWVFQFMGNTTGAGAFAAAASIIPHTTLLYENGSNYTAVPSYIFNWAVRAREGREAPFTVDNLWNSKGSVPNTASERPSQSLLSRSRNASTIPSDINEHVQTLRSLASLCKSVVHLTTHSVVATWGLLLGLVGPTDPVLYLNGTDISASVPVLSHEGMLNGVKVKVLEGKPLVVDLPDEVDMTFIDTWHVYGQLRRELARVAPITRKCIAMHDTTIDGEVGESVRESTYYNIDKQVEETGWDRSEIERGLWPAIEEFLAANEDWVLVQRFENNNGLTVLARRASERDVKQILS